MGECVDTCTHEGTHMLVSRVVQAARSMQQKRMSTLINIHPTGVGMETKKPVEFMDDKQNTGNMDPVFDAELTIHVPQEGKLVIPECGEDSPPELSAHRTIRHVIKRINLPVAKSAWSISCTEPIGGEPTM